jgi:hypothetical protein
MSHAGISTQRELQAPERAPDGLAQQVLQVPSLAATFALEALFYLGLHTHRFSAVSDAHTVCTCRQSHCLYDRCFTWRGYKTINMQCTNAMHLELPQCQLLARKPRQIIFLISATNFPATLLAFNFGVQA